MSVSVPSSTRRTPANTHPAAATPNTGNTTYSS